MARPREFKTEEAIEKAMRVFWETDYGDASLPDLLSGMGLTRGSLYKAFGDKKSLYLLVLQHYENESVAGAVRLLTGPDIPDGRDRIRMLFTSVAESVQQGDTKGCLICTAAAGPAAFDADIAIAVKKALGLMQHGFDVALIDSVPDERNRTNLAAFLTSTYVGLRVRSRSGTQVRSILESVAALDTLLSSCTSET